MLRATGFFILVFLLSSFPARLAQAQGGNLILAPSQGEIIQGQVPVVADIQEMDIDHGEVSFAYAENLTDTWFLIGTFQKPTSGEPLATWDTTTITDGVYTLRVQLVLEDGAIVNQTVRDLQVRNYTSIETATPEPAASPAPTMASPTASPATQAARPTATPLPPNPAELTTADLARGIVRGAAMAAGLFAVLGLYQVIRRQIYH